MVRAIAGRVTGAQARDLVAASDERYFSLGAERHRLGGLDLYVHRGFTDVPAGIVAVGATGTPSFATALQRELHDAVADPDVMTVRVYVSKGSPSARSAVERRVESMSSERCVEVMLFAPAADLSPPERPVRLRAVTTAADWAAKGRIHAGDSAGPDGHRVDPGRWLAFERAKAADRAFTPMLLTMDGEVIGTVALIGSDSLVRLKNIVLAPPWRGQGLAGDLVRAVAEMCPEATLGCMAVADTAGHRAYLAAGMSEVGRVNEWRVPLRSP